MFHVTEPFLAMFMSFGLFIKADKVQRKSLRAVSSCAGNLLGEVQSPGMQTLIAFVPVIVSDNKCATLYHHLISAVGIQTHHTSPPIELARRIPGNVGHLLPVLDVPKGR